MEKKKTTLYVDPEVWHRMKVKAVYEDKTVTELLHEIMVRETESEISLAEFRRDIKRQKEKGKKEKPQNTCRTDTK